MPFIRPTLPQIISRVRADFQTALPTVDPTVRASFARAIVEGISLRFDAAYFVIQQAIDQAFPRTATGIFLERFASEGISRNPAAAATGDVVFTGTAQSVIPISTAIRSTSGQGYTTQAAVTLTAQVASVTSLSSSSGVATAVVAGHSMASGIDVVFAGAVDAEYNGTKKVTVVDENTVTFPIEGTPNSPTSGTITATFSGGIATVVSDEESSEVNLESGAIAKITSPIAGVDNNAIVRFDGITGGSDIEDDESLRDRIIERRSIIASNFSAETISVVAKTVPGVTRVAVRTADPEPGRVTVNFVRDNDANKIPSASDVANVRAELLKILPAVSDEASLIVAAPVPISQAFDFSAIAPNTEAMRNAVTAQLQAFFRDDVEIGQSVLEDVYKAAISQTVAGSTALQSFALSNPPGNIVITADQIAILGAVTFP